MRAFRNILLGVTSFIALLAVVALTADLGVLRPLYEQIASHLLKHEVRILGPLEVRLGRHLEVLAQDVTISGALPNDDPLLSVGAASLTLQLTSLFDNALRLARPRCVMSHSTSIPIMTATTIRAASDDRYQLCRCV